MSRKDPSGKCWYWDAADEKIKYNPFEGSSSDPCKSFSDAMEKIGTHVSTPDEFLKNLPPEVKKELFCSGETNEKQPEYFWDSLGEFQTAYSLPGVSGNYVQYGVHIEDAESGDGNGAAILPVGVSAWVGYNIRYDVIRYSQALVLNLRESYNLTPPLWGSVEDGLVKLQMGFSSHFSKFTVGNLDFKDYPSRQTRETPIVIHATEGLPISLKIKFTLLLSDDILMGYSFGNDVTLPNP